MGDIEVISVEMTDDLAPLSSPASEQEQGNTWTTKEVPIKVESETQTSPQHYLSPKRPELQTANTQSKPKPEDGVYNIEISKPYCKNYHEIQPLVPKKTEFEFPSDSSKTQLSTSRQNLTEDDILVETENVATAYTALFFSYFNFLWSLAVAYWHIRDGCLQEGFFTAMIVFFGGVCVEIVYLTTKQVQLKRIWKESKIVYLLNLIPCLTSIVMSSANAVFALKEHRSKGYRRPWYKTRVIFLTEVLSLSFLQCVFQTCILMEDRDSIPSFKGFFIYFGIIISTIGIAFARIRFDMSQKFERFGKGVEKYMRFTMIWAYKVLWILTFSSSLIVIRIKFPNHLPTATVIGFVFLQLFFELQVMFSYCSKLRKFFLTSVGLFFIIPQFSWLLALILWVNHDTTIYETYIGSIVLGSFFYAEFILLIGWLSDSCRDKETDFISFYPHVFGNTISSMYDHMETLVITA